MRTRILVGLLALPFVLLPLWLGGIWSALLILVLAIAVSNEYFSLMEQGGYYPVHWLGRVWLALMVASGWRPDLLPITLVITAGMIATLTYALFQVEHPVNTWLSTSAGAIYFGLMLSQGVALRELPNGLAWLMLGVLITWANDTAAYFVGYYLGNHKIWPRISPKKTWEGTLGGFVGGAITGGLMAALTPIPLGIPLGIVVGFLGGVLAFFGDLVESMIKRHAGAKDSGRFLPGHGGVWDRMDSILFVIPFVYQIALWLQK